jgi:hypothetical protein
MVIYIGGNLEEKTLNNILIDMINIGATGTPYTFSLYIKDKTDAVSPYYLKMEKGDDDSVRYFELINSSTSDDYNTFMIDPSDLKAGDYTATILTAITGGAEIMTGRSRVAQITTEIPQTVFQPTNNKIVFND